MYCFVLQFQRGRFSNLNTSNMLLAIYWYISRNSIYLCLLYVCNSLLGYLKRCEEKLTCILFSTPQFVQFFLPQNASVASQSSCGKGNTSHPVLVLDFGAGHSLSLNFSESADKYQVEEFVFHYNLSDATLFPNSSAGKMKTSCYCETFPDVTLSPFFKGSMYFKVVCTH